MCVYYVALVLCSHSPKSRAIHSIVSTLIRRREKCENRAILVVSSLFFWVHFTVDLRGRLALN